MIKGLVVGVLLTISVAGYQAETIRKATENRTVAVSVVAKDSAAAVRTVLNLLNWYKNHLDSASRIPLVDRKPGKPYSVNFKNGEKYLA